MYQHTPTRSVKKQNRNKNMTWEVREFKRLLLSLLLLLTVFLGKQICPEQMIQIGAEVTRVLENSTDLNAMFSRLGNSMDAPDNILQGLSEFCVEVFGAKQDSQIAQSMFPAPTLPESPVGLLSQYTPASTLPHTPLPADTNHESAAAVPAVGTVLTVGQPQKQALPDGYTADELSFGALETVAPVIGTVTSGYGYRDHPITGKYCFHGGLDIAADAGTAIAAFADGQVEYVGEDDSYGLYLQIDHGNGIKSFYAHCQHIYVSKGQEVQAGETVALVGSSGTTTGAHLHLELKCAEMRVDPAYYLPFAAAA